MLSYKYNKEPQGIVLLNQFFQHVFQQDPWRKQLRPILTRSGSVQVPRKHAIATLSLTFRPRLRRVGPEALDGETIVASSSATYTYVYIHTYLHTY